MPFSVVIVNTTNGSRTIIHSRGNLREPTVDEFRQQIDPSTFSWIHFEGRNCDQILQMMQTINDSRNETNNSHLRISIEIEKSRYDDAIIDKLIAMVDVCFVSKDFAKSRGFSDMRTAVNGIFERFAKTTAPIMICAWAEHGAAMRLSNGTVICEAASIPNGQVVVDTCGAGDTFVAGMIDRLDRDEDAAVALRFACSLAGQKVSQRGLMNIAGIHSND